MTQLMSWGVLYYAFAVVAPDMASQPGWGLAAVSGAFSAGLLVAGLCAHPVSAMLSRFGPRAVMTAGSLLGIVATMLWASGSSIAMLYAAWSVMGVAMAATLYEPAIVVLALLDSRQLHRTVAAVTVAGGLASTVFVPLVGHLAEALGWRTAVAVLGVGGGMTTAALHARFLPRNAPTPTQPRTSVRSVTRSKPMRRLRIAYAVEQASAVAATALLVTMLIAQGVEPRTAGFVLAVSGVGKVAGRLLLSGRIGRTPPELLAATAAGVHAIAMAGLLVSTSSPWLYPIGMMAGAAAGTSSVLRPLIVAEHVPLHAFGSASARLQTAATPARAVGPLILGGAASHIGWYGGWALIVVALAAAAGIFAVIGRPTAVLARTVSSSSAKGLSGLSQRSQSRSSINQRHPVVGLGERPTASVVMICRPAAARCTRGCRGGTLGSAHGCAWPGRPLVTHPNTSEPTPLRSHCSGHA